MRHGRAGALLSDAAHLGLQVMDEQLSAARSALKGKYPRDLFNHALGAWLTQRAQAVTSAVFVKVVADVRRRVADPDGHGSHSDAGFARAQGVGDGRMRSPGNRGGRGDFYYRSKAVMAFRCLPGSVGDALTFGMYVHEYGAEAPGSYRGKVLLECIDGTPLFHGETADERQRCLSAIAQVPAPLHSSHCRSPSACRVKCLRCSLLMPHACTAWIARAWCGEVR